MQHFKRQTFNWVISGSNSDNQFTWHFLLEALEKKQRRNDQQRENVGYQPSASVAGRRKKTTSPTQYRHIRGSQMQFHSQLTLTWDQWCLTSSSRTFPVHPTLLSSPFHYSKAMHSEISNFLMYHSWAAMVFSLNLHYWKKGTAEILPLQGLRDKTKKVQILHKLGIKLQDINLLVTQKTMLYLFRG